MSRLPALLVSGQMFFSAPRLFPHPRYNNARGLPAKQAALYGSQSGWL
jgi:hypothetical protein